MAYVFKQHISAQAASGGGAITTSAVNMSGVDLLVVMISYFNGIPGTSNPSDSSSNTYLTAVTNTGPTGLVATIYYVQAPTVTSSMTFTASATGGATFASIFALGFSGSTTSPLDQTNSNLGAAVSSIQAGSITPSQPNELVVAAFAVDSAVTALAIGSSYTLVDNITWISNEGEGGADAYLIQTSAAATNPTWSWTTNATNCNALIASFKAATFVPPRRLARTYYLPVILSR